MLQTQQKLESLYSNNDNNNSVRAKKGKVGAYGLEWLRSYAAKEINIHSVYICVYTYKYAIKISYGAIIIIIILALFFYKQT
jgi:hypothetical protein